MERERRANVRERAENLGLPRLTERINNALEIEALPINEKENNFAEALVNNRVVLISSETGAGKTTRVPLFAAKKLISILNCVPSIVVAVPRRMAASGAARYVANTFGFEFGTEVGFTFRHDSQNHGSLINYTTSGYLLREFISNPEMDGIHLIIVDEAHERSTESDMVIGLAKRALSIRDDLRLVIMSATLNIEVFQRYITPRPFSIQMGSSKFLVEIMYLEKDLPVVNSESIAGLASDAIWQLYEQTEDGDILVFLPGASEIKKCKLLVKHKINMANARDLECLVVHSAA